MNAFTIPQHAIPTGNYIRGSRYTTTSPEVWVDTVDQDVLAGAVKQAMWRRFLRDMAKTPNVAKMFICSDYNWGHKKTVSRCLATYSPEEINHSDWQLLIDTDDAQPIDTWYVMLHGAMPSLSLQRMQDMMGLKLRLPLSLRVTNDEGKSGEPYPMALTCLVVNTVSQLRKNAGIVELPGDWRLVSLGKEVHSLVPYTMAGTLGGYQGDNDGNTDQETTRITTIVYPGSVQAYPATAPDPRAQFRNCRRPSEFTQQGEGKQRLTSVGPVPPAESSGPEAFGFSGFSFKDVT